MYQNYIQQRANFNTQETRIESQIKRACGWPYKPGPSTKRKTIHRRAQRTQGARSFKKSYNDAWPINIYHQKRIKNSAIFWIASSLLLQVLRLFYRGMKKKTAKTSKKIN